MLTILDVGGAETSPANKPLNLLSPFNNSNNVERLILERRLIDQAATGDVGATTLLIALYYDDDNRRAYAWAKVLFWLDLVEKRPVRFTDNGEILVQNARRRLIFYEDEKDTSEIALILDRLDNSALSIFSIIQAEKPLIRAGSLHAYSQSAPSNTVERTGGEKFLSGAEPPTPVP